MSRMARALFDIYSRYDLPWWLPIAYFLISAYVAGVVIKYIFEDVSWLDILAANKRDQMHLVGIFLLIFFIAWHVLWRGTIFFLEYFQLAVRA